MAECSRLAELSYAPFLSNPIQPKKILKAQIDPKSLNCRKNQREIKLLSKLFINKLVAGLRDNFYAEFQTNFKEIYP